MGPSSSSAGPDWSQLPGSHKCRDEKRLPLLVERFCCNMQTLVRGACGAFWMLVCPEMAQECVSEQARFAMDGHGTRLSTNTLHVGLVD